MSNVAENERIERAKQLGAMIKRTEQQIEFLQSRKPQHIVSRYGALPRLPKFEVWLVMPTIPSREGK